MSATSDSNIPAVRRVLVVEDDRPLCTALASVVREWGAEAWEAHNADEARALLSGNPELAIVDLWLEGQNAIDFVEELAHHRPAPAIVAISGRASPEESFRLGQLGVRAFLPKPLFKETLVEKVSEALRQAPDVEPWISAHVGKTSLRDMQSSVRRVMLEHAIARSAGSRSGAAKLLQVTRQAIQQVFHRTPPGTPPSGPPPGA